MEDLGIAVEQPLVLTLFDVGLGGGVFERHSVANRGPVARQEDEWCGVGGLGRKRQVQENERVRIEVEDEVDVADDPARHDQGLDDDEPPAAHEGRDHIGDPVAGGRLIDEHLVDGMTARHRCSS